MCILTHLAALHMVNAWYTPLQAASLIETDAEGEVLCNVYNQLESNSTTGWPFDLSFFLACRYSSETAWPSSSSSFVERLISSYATLKGEQKKLLNGGPPLACFYFVIKVERHSTVTRVSPLDALCARNVINIYCWSRCVKSETWHSFPPKLQRDIC